ncbi:hypothetical protein N7495_003662 [Penicillium taxi]|uniref:uncharacterized protein n=1 Tax=Penicillium taxi TaxID=168475 RepID=UPI0025458FCB|nr:uncharacterized protein N7495_003662 [Penicillium taxi]KAJ5898918.1 hypothetical protein N7495_003662 [Penicillium taxi]
MVSPIFQIPINLIIYVSGGPVNYSIRVSIRRHVTSAQCSRLKDPISPSFLSPSPLSCTPFLFFFSPPPTTMHWHSARRTTPFILPEMPHHPTPSSFWTAWAAIPVA